MQRDQRPTRGCTIWLTGLSGSGKSTVAVEVERKLVAAGRPAYLLDGDNLRHGLNADLGFSADGPGRKRAAGGGGGPSVRRCRAGGGGVARQPVPGRARPGAGPARRGRAGLHRGVRRHPLEVCEARDPKGMYAKARAGEITGFTGVDDPYEPPLKPELVLRPGHGSPSAMADWVISQLDG